MSEQESSFAREVLGPTLDRLAEEKRAEQAAREREAEVAPQQFDFEPDDARVRVQLPSGLRGTVPVDSLVPWLDAHQGATILGLDLRSHRRK